MGSDIWRRQKWGSFYIRANWRPTTRPMGACGRGLNAAKWTTTFSEYLRRWEKDKIDFCVVLDEEANDFSTEPIKAGWRWLALQVREGLSIFYCQRKALLKEAFLEIARVAESVPRAIVFLVSLSTLGGMTTLDTFEIILRKESKKAVYNKKSSVYNEVFAAYNKTSAVYNKKICCSLQTICSLLQKIGSLQQNFCSLQQNFCSSQQNFCSSQWNFAVHYIKSAVYNGISSVHNKKYAIYNGFCNWWKKAKNTTLICTITQLSLDPLANCVALTVL